MAEAPKPTHVVAKPDGGRRSNVQVRSYVMEYPSKRMVEAFRIYSCLVDDVFGMDWKTAGGDKLPKDMPIEKKMAARAKLAKDRAAVARVAIEALQYMETQAGLQDPEGRGMSGHVMDAEVASEHDESAEDLKKQLAESTNKLENLGKEEAALQTEGE